MKLYKPKAGSKGIKVSMPKGSSKMIKTPRLPARLSVIKIRKV